MQRYTKLLLFIFILNYIFLSCTSNTGNPNGEFMANNINVEVGSHAPAFSLPDLNGKMVSLSDFVGKSNLVVYFYPKDESYGCTKEACSFRDQYEDFKEAGAEVIGISADDVDSHKSFAANHSLPFILLSDPDKKVTAAYGVGKTMGIFPGRVTFIIDKQGIIRGKFSSQLQFQKHIDEALEVLKGL